MILIVGSTKGGVGKTTLAFNFAVALSKANREVLLVDADRQATAMSTTKLRTQELGSAGYTAIRLYDADIITQVPQLAKKYDDIIIDVGGRDNPSLRSAFLLPKATVLIPVKPRSYELWGAEDTAALIAEARAQGNVGLKAITVINEADHLQEGDNAAATDTLRELKGIEHAPMRIVRRKAYPNAAATGRSVLEYPDPKAVEEFTALVHFIQKQRAASGALSHGNR
jgi:chromosome partitioning protein